MRCIIFILMCVIGNAEAQYIAGKDSVVRVTSESGAHGTGFYIGEMVVTNFHVIQKASRVITPLGVRTIKGEAHEKATITDIHGNVRVGTVVKVDEKNDIALLSVKLDLPPLRFTERIRVGQRVYSYGHPVGHHYAYTNGEVMWVSDDKILVNMAGGLGSSGSPVFSRFGRIIGIVSAIMNPGSGFIIIPSSKIQDML
jgi:S1-C subfamily serine protease